MLCWKLKDFSIDECKELAVGRSKSECFWAVCLKENDKLIGNLYFEQQEPKQFSTWILGYVFNPSYYGIGYATEACHRIIQHGFEEHNAHRIIARCNPENVASWKVLERLNMRREGHFLKPAYFKTTDEGEPIWHDAYQYSILKEAYFEEGRGDKMFKKKSSLPYVGIGLVFGTALGMVVSLILRSTLEWTLIGSIVGLLIGAAVTGFMQQKEKK